MGMKETLYGWYPPAKGTWITHNQDVNSYNKECLYKFTKSRYADEEGVRTPTPESVKITLAPRAETAKTTGSQRSTQRSSGRSSQASDRSRSVRSATPGTRPRSVISATSERYAVRASPIATPASDAEPSIFKAVASQDRKSVATPGKDLIRSRPQSAVSEGHSCRDSVDSVILSPAGGNVHRSPSCMSVASSRPPSSRPPSSRPPTSPKKAWSTRLAETPITVYDSAAPITPYFPIPKPDLTTPLPPELPISQDDMPRPYTSKPERAQSAKYPRDKVETPVRPAYSARPYRGPVESKVGPQECRSDSALLDTKRSGVSAYQYRPPSVQSAKALQPFYSPEAGVAGRRESSRSTTQKNRAASAVIPPGRASQLSKDSSRSKSASVRPEAPVPPEKYGVPPNHWTAKQSPVPSAPLDYDEQLKKYGWKMEVPGDPLNLKKPCLQPRQSYVVQIHGKPVAPKPPVGHMQNYDTFFSNTIPHKPLSFTLHPEMISEVLHAKRMELQKRDGMIYQTKNFAFIY